MRYGSGRLRRAVASLPIWLFGWQVVHRILYGHGRSEHQDHGLRHSGAWWGVSSRAKSKMIARISAGIQENKGEASCGFLSFQISSCTAIGTKVGISPRLAMIIWEDMSLGEEVQSQSGEGIQSQSGEMLAWRKWFSCF